MTLPLPLLHLRLQQQQLRTRNRAMQEETPAPQSIKPHLQTALPPTPTILPPRNATLMKRNLLFNHLYQTTHTLATMNEILHPARTDTFTLTRRGQRKADQSVMSGNESEPHLLHLRLILKIRITTLPDQVSTFTGIIQVMILLLQDRNLISLNMTNLQLRSDLSSGKQFPKNYDVK